MEVKKRYGELVVLSRGELTKNRRETYRCACDCGVEVDIAASYLLNGLTTCCKKCKKIATRIAAKSKGKYSNISPESMRSWITAMKLIQKKIDRDLEYPENYIPRMLSRSGVNINVFMNRITEFRASDTAKCSGRVYLGLYILEEVDKVLRECNYILKNIEKEKAV